MNSMKRMGISATTNGDVDQREAILSANARDSRTIARQETDTPGKAPLLSLPGEPFLNGRTQKFESKKSNDSSH